MRSRAATGARLAVACPRASTAASHFSGAPSWRTASVWPFRLILPVGSRADADVIAATPDGQIMAAFAVRRRVVGYLVSRQVGGVEHVTGHLIEIRAAFLVDGRDTVAVERGARLDGELIHRQMVAGHGHGLAELAAPVLAGLPRQAVDQVEGIALETGSRLGDGAPRFRRRVGAAEKRQRRVIQRLDPNRKPVHAGLAERGKPRGLRRRGVGLQRNLQIGSGWPVAADRGDQGMDRVGIHQRWRAAAEEDTADRALLGLGGEILEFTQQCRRPPPMVHSFDHVAVEIAVRALGKAEWPVDIDGQGQDRTTGVVGGLHGGYEKQAATSLRKASARWLIRCFSSGSISPKVMSRPSATNIGS